MAFFAMLVVATSSGSVPATCSADWNVTRGVCLCPHPTCADRPFRNVSVAGAPDVGAACCSACAADKRCAAWFVRSIKHSGFEPFTCVLNQLAHKSSAPSAPDCISGRRAVVTPTWPPTPAPKPAPAKAKNVLFLAVDDLRPDINSYSSAAGPIVPGTVTPRMHTPHFDALARDALLLLKNYVQQAVCSPTRTSLLTGRRPDRTRVYDLYSYSRIVAANYTTIPEFFLRNGYKTQGMGKIFHPGHASGSDDSCCSWSNASEYFHAPNLDHWSGSTGPGNGGRSWMAVPPALETAFPLPDNQTADHAVEALSKLKAEHEAGDARPFFLAVGFHKPHLPYVASEVFFDFYPEADIQLPLDQQPPVGMPASAWSSYGELRNYLDQTNASGDPGTVLPKEDVLGLRRAYYASVTQTDAMLGKVMAALSASGFGDNTVVSIWGDHGYQLGEHGEWCKHTNFEFATRAPMMIKVPGLTDGGVRSRRFTEHVDLFPTLTEAAAGITLPPCPPGDGSFHVATCTEGTSLVPLMKDPETAVKAASFSQYPRAYVKPHETMAQTLNTELLGSAPSPSKCILTGPHDEGCTMGYSLVTVVDGCEYRYTEWCDFNTAGFPLTVNWARNVGTELYNHSADPGENVNLNATRIGSFTVEALSRRLSAMLHAGPTSGPMLELQDDRATATAHPQAEAR